MVTSLKIALAQINTVVGDLYGNSQKILSSIKNAEALGCDLVLFPELTMCGYPPEDLLLKPHFIADIKAALNRIVPAVQNLLAVIGSVEQDSDGNIYNIAVVISKGKIHQIYRKNLLPNYMVFDEKRYFAPGRELSSFELNGYQIGLSICEDIWESSGPVLRVAKQEHTQIILNLSSSPYHLGKGLEREQMLQKRAVEIGNYICYANLVGGQDELVFDGDSMIIDHLGKVVARGKQFEEDLLVIDIGDQKVDCPQVRPRLSELAEVYQALVLGVKDYVEKNRFKKVVIGLSGGIDSALTAVIAVEALGKANVVCVSMPSQYSSEGIQNDAKELAKILGVEFKEIPITNIFQTMESELKPFFDDLPSNIAEENLQARIRGNLLMSLSNKFGWMLLTTGNKSEMATGYCTLYGDMAGGYNVLKDVSKTLVFRLSRWLNEEGIVIPPSIIDRPPSAELRPNQTDQDSLPPYEILDQILEYYVEADLSLDEIVAKGFAKDVVIKTINLVDRNEYKRRQAAPGVRITPKAFGKDRRMPLTNRYVV